LFFDILVAVDVMNPLLRAARLAVRYGRGGRNSRDVEVCGLFGK
jgi:hypothetical protein